MEGDVAKWHAYLDKKKWYIPEDAGWEVYANKIKGKEKSEGLYEGIFHVFIEFDGFNEWMRDGNDEGVKDGMEEVFDDREGLYEGIFDGLIDKECFPEEM